MQDQTISLSHWDMLRFEPLGPTTNHGIVVRGFHDISINLSYGIICYYRTSPFNNIFRYGLLHKGARMLTLI